MSDDQSTPARPVEYRIVDGFPAYRVGDDGSVWTRWIMRVGPKSMGDWREMKLTPTNEWGHLRVTLCPGLVCRLVHHLVLEAFVGPCPPGMECCHNDGNPANNHLTNLRWDTPKANAADKQKHGTHSAGEKNGAARLTEETVKAIRAEYDAIKGQRRRFPNGVLPVMAAKYGTTVGNLKAITLRLTWQHLT